MSSDDSRTIRLRIANSTSDNHDRLLTVAEVSKLTGLSVGGLYHYVSQKRIPVVRLAVALGSGSRIF